jgi:type IV pilus assembly protein PilW
MIRLVTADRRGGFTLVELLVAIAIGGVLLTATYELLNTNSKLYYSKENTMMMTRDLRASTDFLIREIRMAGCNPTGASGIGFQDDTSATSIHFNMDIDGDGAISSTEEIEYYTVLLNVIDSLLRRTGGATNDSLNYLIAEDITSLEFIYYDSTGAELTSLSTTDLGNIYAVKFTINAETPKADAITHVKKTDSMTTRVRIRNAGLQ